MNQPEEIVEGEFTETEQNTLEGVFLQAEKTSNHKYRTRSRPVEPDTSVPEYKQEPGEQHPQYDAIMRSIRQQTRLLKMSRGFHPTKAKLSHAERKAKRKTQKASRRNNR